MDIQRNYQMLVPRYTFETLPRNISAEWKAFERKWALDWIARFDRCFSRRFRCHSEVDHEMIETIADTARKRLAAPLKGYVPAWFYQKVKAAFGKRRYWPPVATRVLVNTHYRFDHWSGLNTAVVTEPRYEHPCFDGTCRYCQAARSRGEAGCDWYLPYSLAVELATRIGCGLIFDRISFHHLECARLMFVENPSASNYLDFLPHCQQVQTCHQ